LTVAQYAVTVGYGFHYDDYHFVRPYPAHEVLSAFHGAWDSSGIETPYFRPLTICLYAARFAMLGLNSEAYHLLSLAMFAVAAALFGLLAANLTDTFGAGLVGVAVFVVHPGMPYSAVAWVTNQMHLAQLLVVITGLLWWFAVRRRSMVWWTPLLLFQIIAFLIKEDGVMLIPLIVCLHTLRKALAEPDMPHVPRLFLGSAAAVLSALFFLRSSALQGVPPHRLPGVDQAWANLTRGLTGAFRLLPAKRPWQPAASWFVTLLPVAALMSWRRLTPGVRFGLVAGVMFGVVFVLPFVFIIKAEQLHLVTAGACLLIAASAAGVIQACARIRLAQLCAAAIVAAGLAAMASVARNITRDFEPFGPIVLRTDRIVEGWAAVPTELREYLGSKAVPGAGASLDANPARALAVVAFGLHGREMSPDGTPLRWMSGPIADIFIARDKRLVMIPLRHEIGAFREPAHMRIFADGRLVSEIDLADGAWHTTSVNLKRRDASGAGRMHRVRLQIAHAWIPAQLIPGSADTRTLGLQVGVLDVR
jgi:hypothetical protein